MTFPGQKEHNIDMNNRTQPNSLISLIVRHRAQDIDVVEEVTFLRCSKTMPATFSA